MFGWKKKKKKKQAAPDAGARGAEKTFSSDFAITKLEPMRTDAKVLAEYSVDLAKVDITSDGLYNVTLPAISEGAEKLLLRHMDDIYVKFSGATDEDHAAVIDKYIDDADMDEDDFKYGERNWK